MVAGHRTLCATTMVEVSRSTAERRTNKSISKNLGVVVVDLSQDTMADLPSDQVKSRGIPFLQSSHRDGRTSSYLYSMSPFSFL